MTISFFHEVHCEESIAGGILREADFDFSVFVNGFCDGCVEYATMSVCHSLKEVCSFVN